MALHEWIQSTRGHGEQMCARCKITNREAAALSQMNVCQALAPGRRSPDSMAEKVARAFDPAAWDFIDQHTDPGLLDVVSGIRNAQLRNARAAISAMREPTRPMAVSGVMGALEQNEHVGTGTKAGKVALSDGRTIRAAYRAMIDEALK